MVTKILHWCALRISDLGECLFDLGGALECWCDARFYERGRKARIKRWQEWTGYDVIDVPLSRVYAEDLAICSCARSQQLPITMLDDYAGMTTREVYDALKQEDE